MHQITNKKRYRSVVSFIFCLLLTGCSNIYLCDLFSLKPDSLSDESKVLPGLDSPDFSITPTANTKESSTQSYQIDDLTAIRKNARWRLQMNVDFGHDTGQSLGTLFEAFDSDGKVICGAGFNSTHQTRVTMNNRVLEFFCRSEDDNIKVVDLGNPDINSSRPRLYQYDDQLIDLASNRVYISGVKWQDYSQESDYQQILNIQIIHNDPLFFLRIGDRIDATYRGVTLASIKGDPKATLFYNNRIFIAARDYESGDNYVYYFDWNPYDVKYSTNPMIEQIILPENYRDVYAMYGYQDRVLIAGSSSSIIELRDREIKITQPDALLKKYVYDIKKSEAYSFINYFGKLLIGHFPTGFLLEYSPEGLKTLRNYPPLAEGQWHDGDVYYREAQALSIYGGELYVGMYPWGQVWRLNRDANQWDYIRLFDSPPFTSVKYPYFRECYIWDWAQRIDYLTPFNGSLIAGMGSMGQNPQEAEGYPCLDWLHRLEYGKVKQLTLPNSTMAQIKWTDGPTEFEFILSEDGQFIIQDGVLIAHNSGKFELDQDITILQVTYGTGAYGNLNGKILSKSIDQ
jgi:hypothetical protein